MGCYDICWQKVSPLIELPNLSNYECLSFHIGKIIDPVICLKKKYFSFFSSKAMIIGIERHLDAFTDIPLIDFVLSISDRIQLHSFALILTPPFVS